MIQTATRPAPKMPASPEANARRTGPPRPAAMLAICSDLDETPDAETYFEIMRFLNTTEDTRMGAGVGLEIGNTMYFDMAAGHFSYWNADEADRERIRALIRSGHIDCLHSFGDFATTRAHAGRALDELARHDCCFKVWVDHAQAPTNLGADIMRGHGDEPGHPAYHTDLTLGHGIQYVWRGRVTSVIGQDCRFSLRAVWCSRHPLGSARTLAKEMVKQLLSRMGNRKYALHAGNRLLGMSRLRDGHLIPEFIRCNPSWAGVSCHDRGDAIHAVLTRRFLDRLAARGGYSVLYTHLGKLEQRGTARQFHRKTIAAFRLLAEYERAGRIHVMTTSRLLEHRSVGGRRSTPGMAAATTGGEPRLVFPSI